MCKTKINNILSFLLLHILIFITKVSANNEFCYTSGGVFGIIIASVIVTLVVILIALATLWFLWTKNRIKLDFILNKSKKVSKKTDLESAKNEYAFDNPYFKEDDTIDGTKKENSLTQKETIILLEGKEIDGKTRTNEEVNNLKVLQDKPRNGQMINNRFVKSLPLSAVFNNVHILNKKHKHEYKKSMDDSFVIEKPEKLEVELIGHDFTGLGFNICGNMKDGIYIKDVQSRGPANESGKVKAGDRIKSVTVSFEKMVYEDAVSILSYASPYNVRIELEKSIHYSNIDKLSNNPIINKNMTLNIDKQLLHPLYRSHSVDDLTRIGKELSLSEKSTSSAGKNVVQKIKSQIFNRKNHSIKNLDENSSKSVNTRDEEQKIENSQISVVQTIGGPENNFNKTIIETIETNAMSASDQTDLTENKVLNFNINEKEKERNDDIIKSTENQVIKVTPPKRKGRAPQPPQTSVESSQQTNPLPSESILVNQSNGETIETTALVHNEETKPLKSEDNLNEENKIIKIENDMKPIQLNGSLSSSSESISSEEHNKSSDLTPIPVQSNSPQRVQSPTGKPKSSSMSDLTNNNTDKLQSILLERAVSLDMNAQNLPEENLTQHGKNLLVPNDDNSDSMPIINWNNNNINKQNLSETNSSESTLNEINQVFIINELPQKYENSVNTKAIISSDTSIDSISENGNNDKLIEDIDSISYFSTEPNTSTPLKIDKNSAIDQYFKVDSSSSSEDEKEEHTLVEQSDSYINNFSPDLKLKNNCNDMQIMDHKEVIELSKSELDDVMMSHKAFLIKQAKINGSYPNIAPPLKTSGTDPHLESLDFESWSYMSEDENYIKNKSQTDTDSTLYTTALDISDSNDYEQTLKPKKLPEVAGITLKTGEKEQLTNTVMINTNDLSNSSFCSTSSSPTLN